MVCKHYLDRVCPTPVLGRNIVRHNWFENALDNKLSCFPFICDFRIVYYNTFLKESAQKAISHNTTIVKDMKEGFIYVLKQPFF